MALAPEAQGVGRGGVCVRALERSGEAELAPEAKGSGEPRFGPEIEKTDMLGSCPGDCGWFSSSFAIFIALI